LGFTLQVASSYTGRCFNTLPKQAQSTATSIPPMLQVGSSHTERCYRTPPDQAQQQPPPLQVASSHTGRLRFVLGWVACGSTNNKFPTVAGRLVSHRCINP
jgi:hypothetical protein